MEFIGIFLGLCAVVGIMLFAAIVLSDDSGSGKRKSKRSDSSGACEGIADSFDVPDFSSGHSAGGSGDFGGCDVGSSDCGGGDGGGGSD